MRCCFEIVKISLHYGMMLLNLDAVPEKIAKNRVLSPSFFYGYLNVKGMFSTACRRTYHTYHILTYRQTC